MEIKCKFNICRPPGTTQDLYACFIAEANINEKNHVIKYFIGNHQKGKTHKDVECVQFKSANVNYFPRGLNKHFPNLNRLEILNSGINEISKNDLAGLKRLGRLSIQKSELTALPDDLLTKMPNLQVFSFVDNKIAFASSELLKPLHGRRGVVVNFKRNGKLDACFWPGDNTSLNSLDDLMKLIDEKCIKPVLTNNTELWISGRFSDLTIIAQDNQFKTHKSVLGIKNVVFSQIFEDQIDANVIKIPDFSSKSVEALLHFIYTDEVLNNDNEKENFEIAVKFKVPDMKVMYENIISNQLDEFNAWETFMFAHRSALQVLKEKAFHLIARKIPDQVPIKFLEKPEKLKKLLEIRRACEEALED